MCEMLKGHSFEDQMIGASGRESERRGRFSRIHSHEAASAFMRAFLRGPIAALNCCPRAGALWAGVGDRNFFCREVGTRVRMELRLSPGAGDVEHNC